MDANGTGRRAAIHLGDLVRALAQMPDATATERELAAQCLGFHGVGATIPDHPALPPRPVQAAYNQALLRHYRQPPTPQPPTFTAPPAMPPVPEPPLASDGEVLPTELETSAAPLEDTAASALETRVRNAAPLSAAQAALPRQPLFAPKTARGLVTAAVLRPVPGQDLHIAKLLQAAVRRQHLQRLPLLPRLSARNGCQLLLDFSDALMPWWDDMQTLLRQFRQLLGEDACPVYEFDQAPGAAVRWTPGGDIPWRPVPGKPVVVASDFGVTLAPRGMPRSGKAEWEAFLAVCQNQQVPVIALSPLRPERCPHGLDRRLALLHWHPATSATMVKRRVAAAAKAAR